MTKQSIHRHVSKGTTSAREGVLVVDGVDEEKLFFANPLNRFSLGTKNTTLKYAPDGSLTIYLGAKSPGKENEMNWIPGPSAPFSLLLRSYWPEAVILDGTWLPPQVEKMIS